VHEDALFGQRLAVLRGGHRREIGRAPSRLGGLGRLRGRAKSEPARSGRGGSLEPGGLSANPTTRPRLVITVRKCKSPVTTPMPLPCRYRSLA
jgi:hypothetical protein